MDGRPGSARVTRWLRRLVLLGVLVAVKIGWVWSARTSFAPAIDGIVGDEVMARRRYLIGRHSSPSYFDDAMVAPPEPFGSEWKLVSLSMTQAALTNIAFDRPDTRAEAVETGAVLIEHALSEVGRGFDRHAWDEDPLASLDGPRGHVGYLGHLAFMLGAFRIAGGDERHDRLRAEVVAALCRRIEASPSRHIETYPGETYTADNAVAMAAIAIDARVRSAEPPALLGQWVTYTRRHLLDADNGLVVFGVSPTGEAIGRGRGSAAGYNSFYLPFVDKELAAEQYRALVATLVERTFGLLVVREYDVDTIGGDVDSGPLVFGASPAATGFAIAGARHAGDVERVEGLLTTAEVIGSSVEWGGERRYALAPLVGDSILVAMRTAREWDTRYVDRRR